MCKPGAYMSAAGNKQPPKWRPSGMTKADIQRHNKIMKKPASQFEVKLPKTKAEWDAEYERIEAELVKTVRERREARLAAGLPTTGLLY